MVITRQTVLHIASLARLQLDEAEIEPLMLDLSKIVSYVAELEQLDTSDVPPTVQLASGGVTRPDERKPGLTHEQALSAAPRSIQGGFVVPGFVDES